MKITLAQIKANPGNKKKNITKICEILDRTFGELVIYPELVLTGYLQNEKIYELAECIESDCIKYLCEVAESKKKNIIFGMPEYDNKLKLYYNSAMLITKSGKIHVYRKNYLPNFSVFNEKYFFTESYEKPVFQLNDCRIGIEICYDIFFPEISKHYALSGAELIICISASPQISKNLFELMIPARAVETTTYFVYVNNVGKQKKLTFWGGSCVASPDGKIIAKCKYYNEDIVEIDLNFEDLKYARINRPVLKDTIRISH